MSADRSRVLVAVRVPCEPAEAFARFTAEIDQWWQPNPLFQFSDRRNGTLSFEAGEGGRLIETYDDGTAFVIGVISTWTPSRRLVLSWRHAASLPISAPSCMSPSSQPNPDRPASPSSTSAGTPSPPTTPSAITSPSPPSNSASPNGGAASSAQHSRLGSGLQRGPPCPDSVASTAKGPLDSNGSSPFADPLVTMVRATASPVDGVSVRLAGALGGPIAGNSERSIRSREAALRG